jgi:hypothetical protein
MPQKTETGNDYDYLLGTGKVRRESDNSSNQIPFPGGQGASMMKRYLSAGLYHGLRVTDMIKWYWYCLRLGYSKRTRLITINQRHWLRLKTKNIYIHREICFAISSLGNLSCLHSCQVTFYPRLKWLLFRENQLNFFKTHRRLAPLSFAPLLIK